MEAAFHSLDPRIVELTKFIEHNGWRHRACLPAMRDVRSQFGGSSDEVDSPETLATCEALEGRLMILRSRGNDTRFFPENMVMCLPSFCTEGFVREYFIIREVFVNMLDQPDIQPSMLALRKAVQDSRVTIDRIVSFSSDAAMPLKLDFVIAGFPLSGTSTLNRALGKHPQIVTLPYEDNELWQAFHTSRSVKRWARPYLELAAQKRATLPTNLSGKLIFGLKEPMMVFSSFVLDVIAQLKHLKVIILVREPLLMIESWIKHAANWQTHHGDELYYTVGLLHRHLMHLVFSRIPKDRVLVVPTAALDREPEYTHQRIMEFLGLRATPAQGRQALAKRGNEWERGLCALLGRCFSLCDAQHNLFRSALSSFLAADKFQLDELLAQDGWPAHARGIGRAAVCSRRLDSTAPMLGVCDALGALALPQKLRCFDTMDSCLSCCFSMEGDCKLYGAKWLTCCEPLQAWYMTFLKREGRRLTCKGGTSPKLGCCGGRGRATFSVAP